MHVRSLIRSRRSTEVKKSEEQKQHKHKHRLVDLELFQEQYEQQEHYEQPQHYPTQHYQQQEEQQQHHQQQQEGDGMTRNAMVHVVVPEEIETMDQYNDNRHKGGDAVSSWSLQQQQQQQEEKPRQWRPGIQRSHGNRHLGGHVGTTTTTTTKTTTTSVLGMSIVTFDLNHIQYYNDPLRDLNNEQEWNNCWYNKQSIQEFHAQQLAMTQYILQDQYRLATSQEAKIAQEWKTMLIQIYHQHATTPQENSVVVVDNNDTDDDNNDMTTTTTTMKKQQQQQEQQQSLEDLYRQGSDTLIGLETNLLTRIRGKVVHQNRTILQYIATTTTTTTSTAAATTTTTAAAAMTAGAGVAMTAGTTAAVNPDNQSNNNNNNMSIPIIVVDNNNNNNENKDEKDQTIATTTTTTTTKTKTKTTTIEQEEEQAEYICRHIASITEPSIRFAHQVAVAQAKALLLSLQD